MSNFTGRSSYFVHITELIYFSLQFKDIAHCSNCILLQCGNMYVSYCFPGQDFTFSGESKARRNLAWELPNPILRDGNASFGWLVGFLTSSSTTRLYRGRAPRQERLTILRAATHETELGDHGFCFSRSHYTDTDPTSRERAATAGIESGSSSPGVARSTAELPLPPGNVSKQWLEYLFPDLGYFFKGEWVSFLTVTGKVMLPSYMSLFDVLTFDIW